MVSAVIPQGAERRQINSAVRAEINQCYTCASCVSECPVNRATNRLQPRKLVWMANLGLLDELLRSPEIWFCIGCERCNRACPMSVKPATLIRYLRWRAVHDGGVAASFRGEWRQALAELQRARFESAAELLNGSGPHGADGKPAGGGAEQAIRPVTPLHNGCRDPGLARRVASYLGYSTHLGACFACEECSNACPISLERSVFDPLRLVRLANLGIKTELLRSPSLWLCLQCESCTQGCGQGVKGHLVISRLQQMAVEEGLVPADFRERWRHRQEMLYQRFLGRIEELLAGSTGGSTGGSTETPGS